MASAKAKKESAPAKPKLSLKEINAKIVEMMTRHSPFGLTFSNVSRWTKVPRSTLYYYYGSSKQKMVEAAIEASLKKLMVLDLEVRFEDAPTWEDYQFLLLARATTIVQKFPWAPELYFRYRSDQGYIGDLVRKIEERYFQDRAQGWMHYFPHEKPTWESLRMSSVMKLGMLYGLCLDPDHWLAENHTEKRKKMISILTNLVRELHETKW
jgi:hypothetical protein